MALNKNLPVITTKKFTYVKETKTFVAEASDFGAFIGDLRTRIWDDACDEGFILQSHTTGRQILMVYEEPGDDLEGYFEDGHILAQFNAYEMFDGQTRSMDLKLKIFND